MRLRRISPSLLFAALGFMACCIASLAAPVPRRAEAEVDLAEGLYALASGDVEAAIAWLSKAAELRPDEGTRRGPRRRSRRAGWRATLPRRWTTAGHGRGRWVSRPRRTAIPTSCRTI